jgi:hypothetical protein
MLARLAYAALLALALPLMLFTLPPTATSQDPPPPCHPARLMFGPCCVQSCPTLPTAIVL